MQVGLEREQKHGTAREGIKFLRMAIFLQREAKIWKTEGLATHVATNEFFPGLPVEALEAQYSL